MAVERTLSIIKPDAVGKNLIGEIYSRIEKAGLRIVAARMAHLSQREAEGFYAVHRERPFFKDLVKFMISGPVKAAPGTIRADFAQSIEANAVHGSDAPETAEMEIAYFFPVSQVFSR